MNHAWKGKPMASLTRAEAIEAAKDLALMYQQATARLEAMRREMEEARAPKQLPIVRLPVLGKINGADQPAKVFHKAIQRA